MLSEFLISSASGKEFSEVIVWALFTLGVLGSILPIIFQILSGRGKFKGQSMFERFLLFLVAFFVMSCLSFFTGFGCYVATKELIIYQDADISKDNLSVKKYYDIKPKYGKLEFTLKEPLFYSNVLKDKIAVPILHEDSKGYQVEYNEHVYKIEK